MRDLAWKKAHMATQRAHYDNDPCQIRIWEVQGPGKKREWLGSFYKTKKSFSSLDKWVETTPDNISVLNSASLLRFEKEMMLLRELLAYYYAGTDASLGEESRRLTG